MIHQKHPTHPKSKNVYCRYSERRILKNDVFFYILLIFLLKIGNAHLQYANNPNENISNTSDSSNSPPYFTFPETSSHPPEAVPAIEAQATEIAPLSDFDSNSSNIPNSPSTFKKSISKTDDLELAKIEPSDYSSMMNVQSLDVGKSGDSFIGSRMKSTQWAPTTNQGSKNEKKLVPGSNTEPKKTIKDETSQNVRDENLEDQYETVASSEINYSNDDFCESNSSLVSFNGSIGVESEINEETNSSTLDSIVQQNGPFITKPETEEYKEAKRMTKCNGVLKLSGTVCVCNKTYCDKLLPIEKPPPGKFFWYRSSKDGARFYRTDGKLRKWYPNDSIKDAFFIYLRGFRARFSKKFIGYGGGFSDSASRNIESLSKQTRRHLMRSYYGLFGLEYNLGRVPIGGTDFSPRFYTYMDVEKKFMLSEQDFKYKIPALQEAIEIIPEDLKLIGSSWTAPKWMKTNCSQYNGELKPEYYQLYADYHVMFLDHYAKNGIKFWALSAANKPMTPHKVIKPPFINGMEWSPYKHSKWVNRYLKPTLNKSGYKNVKLIVGDENRDMITHYLRWFFDPLKGEKYYDKEVFLVNEAYDDVSGISVHGYGDSPANDFFLTQLSNFYQNDKFILLGETACYGKPQMGDWDCAERYAMQMMNYFFEDSAGFIDKNLALDQVGGPSYLNSGFFDYLNNFYDAAIIVNTEQDEFYKQPMYYVIAHFSKFMIPESRRAVLYPFNSTSLGIAAIAAQRPDDSTVIVAYNRSPRERAIIFVVDEKYELLLHIPAKSINSVIFTYPQK